MAFIAVSIAIITASGTWAGAQWKQNTQIIEVSLMDSLEAIRILVLNRNCRNGLNKRRKPMSKKLIGKILIK